jgi:hypothetical protein
MLGGTRIKELWGLEWEPAKGFEPLTCCLRNSCSAPELRWRGGANGTQKAHEWWALAATSRSVSYRGGARQARARSLMHAGLAVALPNWCIMVLRQQR